jgi:hypothetical protein
MADSFHKSIFGHQKILAVNLELSAKEPSPDGTLDGFFGSIRVTLKANCRD